MNTISGTAGADTLVGTSAADEIYGGDGNDTITGGAGNDVIYGGKGTDTVAYSGAYSNFTITALYEGKNSAFSGYTVADKLGSEGTDTLSNDVEFLTFSSGTVSYKLDNGTVTVVDTIAPTALVFSPADEATTVAIGANIVVTFSEAIAKGTGSIVLKTAAGVTVATYDAATSSNLSISASTLTINPTADLANSTGYKLEFAAGSVKDTAGNSYAGTTSYNFTTAAATVSVAQFVTGTALNDSFQSAGGNDTFDGGSGTDTVKFNGNLSNYSITKSGTSYVIVDASGTDGTDTIKNVESLQFSDKSINLTIKATTAAAPAADVTRLVELYVAFFNRVPDADGLSYWLGQMSAGKTITQVADAFYSAGVQYSSLTGFSSSMSDGDFVKVIYKNVLGRTGTTAPPDADVNYWVGKLTSGADTRGSLIDTILGAAHNYKGDTTWGYVANLLDNKVTVAKLFAIDYGLNYNTANDSITQGMAIAAAVTSTGTAAAVTLIGVSDTALHLG